MEKEAVIKRIKEYVLKMVDTIVCIFILCGLMIILLFHKICPFFPVLFLFDFCFWLGHPLFVRYVLKKKWFECTKNFYLKIRYILLPCLIMELVVLLYYHKATLYIITTIMDNNN
jgi:hypothetical protein